MIQYIQTAVSTVVVAMLLWVGATLNTLQTSGASVTVELQHLKADLAEIKLQMGEAYPLSQAQRDREDFRRLQGRVRRLEVRDGALPTVKL